MATITDLTRALSDQLGVEHSAVAWAARKLQLDGAVPTGERGRHGGVAMTAEDAAMLLIGFLGAPRAGDAPEAARVFGKLPAVAAVYQVTDGARVTRVAHAIEDISIGPGEAARRAALTGSLHGVFAGII
ncbi:MAG: hypothetical protein IH987_08085, partial [Planctomycetes bacterium]|nr:hypothetical protein [Planctomycetota bacterium]